MAAGSDSRVTSSHRCRREHLRIIGRLHSGILSVVSFAFVCYANLSVADGPSQAIDFEKSIAPLLAKHCLECHSSSTQEGGLDLSNRQSMMQGGESGLVVEPGDVTNSPMWTMVESGEMPKDRPPLSEREHELLKAWLSQGAKWTIDRVDPLAWSTDRRAGYDWWSLQPVIRPTVPKVENVRWSTNAIDAFILSRLEQEGLQPADQADRRTLIRRLTYDLIGLPPTPDEVDAFLSDPAEDAYAKVVDRLLASKHYGERWARHWLDVVRFGETQGFERNRIRENAWQYRDWVIRAFNEDLPYNDFVRMQVAGDVLFPDNFDALMANATDRNT
jgi:hypothetical protein